MAVRILIVAAVLMALYGWGQSPETRDSSEGLEPLGPEASAFGTAVLTGQNVELEFNVVEQADQDSRLLAHVYLECGYGGEWCAPDTWYEDLPNALLEPAPLLRLVGASVLITLVGAAVLIILIWWLSTRR
jgi:hypothetical protein